jgi:hypothetical protein
VSTTGMRLRGPVPERIEAQLNRTADCWLWTGDLDRAGYGKLWSDGRHQRVHRLAYEAWVGAIPSGMELDHLCRVRNCVNPAHLEPVTSRENTLRGESFAAVNAKKTHCLRGHALDKANTYINPAGARVCRECKRARQRRYKASRGQS